MAWGDETWLKKFDFMRRRKAAYQRIPTDVLEDLAKFCRASETCFHEDQRKHAILEGRREVWLRIQNHIGLTPEQLMMLFDGRGSLVYQEQEK